MLRQARNLHFEEYPYERIFLVTGVPPSVFLLYRKKWDKLKTRVDDKILIKIREKSISQHAKEFMEKGFKVQIKFMDRLLKRETEIQPKDAKLISDSMANFHRIHQLEMGRPTDISVYENMSPAQATAYLLEMQKQLAAQHDMTMFSDAPEEDLLKEFANGSDSEVH